MTPPLGKLAAAFVIARRDYSATVFSRSFLFFLLGPLFPILLGLLFGGIGAQVASQAEQPRVAVIATPQQFEALRSAREELQQLPGVAALPRLQRIEAGSDPDQVLAGPAKPLAVLWNLDRAPHLTGSLNQNAPIYGQMKLIISWSRQGIAPLPELGLTNVRKTAGATQSARSATARAGQALLFLLTLLLAGMLLSQLIEEKSNKVIEVLAAAVPVESIFIGKLFAMLAMSLTGIAVWASAAVGAIWLLAPPGALGALPEPAIGWLAFLLLGAAYFAMSYLLIGAAFLGIGAQASTVREVQTLSMPVTMAQVALFALASFAVNEPTRPMALAAAAFPLSSPFAMIARAALDGAWWPHLVALAWQALWVSLILKIAAAWFRRSVLSGSGPKRKWWKRSRAGAGA